MAPILSVRLDALDELAGELAALAAELAEDTRLCRSTARSIQAALGGDEGWAAGAAAAAWAGLTGALAGRTEGMAGTLRAAVGAYRDADEAVAERFRSSGIAPAGER